MNSYMLTSLYLSNYRENLSSRIYISKEDTFDFFKVKVNLYNKKNYYDHYLNISDFNRTAIYGSIGSGKTYVLKRVLNNILSRSLKICMYFDLKGYNGEDIFHLVAKELKYKNISKDCIKKYINEDKICFLFDNYDSLNLNNRNRIKNLIFNNEELKDIKYIVSSKECIEDINFIEEYTLKSLSIKKVYKKVLMNYCNEADEIITIKNYINKYRLKCFLYKPVNLNYLLNIAECEGNLKFLYNLKSEIDLYKKYLEVLIKDKTIISILSYIAYYITRMTEGKIHENKLKELTGEAVGNVSDTIDVDNVYNIIKDKLVIKSSTGSKTLIFADENLKMYLVDEYILENKIKINEVILNRKFAEFLKWKCGVDSNFTYKNLEKLSDEFIKEMLMELEDSKVDNYYGYIQLFLKDSAYKELMDKLNLIYQRFRWENEVQRLTLEFLKSINSEENSRIIKFICKSDNNKDFYKILDSEWKKQSENSDIIKKVYKEISEKNNKVQTSDCNKSLGRRG